MTLAGIQCANAENLQGVVYLKNGGVKYIVKIN